MAMLERGVDLPFWPKHFQLSSRLALKPKPAQIAPFPHPSKSHPPLTLVFSFPLTIYHLTMARSPLSTRLCALIASLLFLLSAQAAAQSTTSTSAPPTTTGAVTASIYPGTSTWGYIGCYNETDAINGTGGLRALSGGPNEVLTNMTVGECLSSCSGYAYAGLEYSR
jgi:hypothetical protein